MSLILSSAFCDLGRQRQIVGLAQPGDHRDGDGCHGHQQEGRREVIAASLLYRWRCYTARHAINSAARAKLTDQYHTRYDSVSATDRNGGGRRLQIFRY